MGEKLVESATFLNKKNSEYIVHVYSMRVIDLFEKFFKAGEFFSGEGTT